MADFKEIQIGNGQVFKVKDETARENAGSGDGTVTAVKMNNGTPIEPDENGVVNLGTVITQHQDISGKADKSEMSVVNGTGSNADKTTITLKSGTSAMVLKQHQDISGKANTADLATVATSGSYADLDNKPTILSQQQVQAMIDEAVEDVPTKTSDLEKDDVYTKTEVDNAIANANQGESVVTSLDDVVIIDDNFTSPTVLAAPSAREMREIYLNLKALYDGLAGIAFTGTKPTWQAVTKSSFNLTTSLTDCTSAIQSGDAGSGKVYEGAVVVRLTPTTNYAFSSIAVTKTSGGDAVEFTQTAGIGYMDISFVCTEAVTVTATAISGYAVRMSDDSQNATVTPASVLPNSALTATIQAARHYTLPQTLSYVKVNNVSLSASDYTYTIASDNKTATLSIAADKINGDIVIKVLAATMIPIAVTLNGTNVVFKHGTDTLTGSVNVYEDDKPYTINVKPLDGYSMSAPTATGCTVESDGDGGYNVTIPTTVTSNLTITATASMPTTLELNTKWFQAPATEPTIEDGVPFELELTPMTNFVAAQDQAAMTGIEAKEVKAAVQVLMNSVDITEDSGVVTFDKTANKVTIYIANPAGAVVINATARLKMKYGKGLQQNAAETSGDGNWCYNVGAVPFPDECKPVKTFYYGFARASNMAIVAYFYANTNDYCGANGTNGVRQFTDNDLGSATSFKASVALDAAIAGKYGDDTTLPSMKAKIDGGSYVEIISPDDYKNALYVS